jgi:pre-mRNA-splicing factor CWC26
MKDALAAYRGSVQSTSSDYKESKKKKKKDKKQKGVGENVKIYDPDEQSNVWKGNDVLTNDERRRLARDDQILVDDEEEFQPIIVQDENVQAHVQDLERRKAKISTTGEWKEIGTSETSPKRNVDDDFKLLRRRHDSDDEDAAIRRRHDSDDEPRKRRSPQTSARASAKDLSPPRKRHYSPLQKSPPRRPNSDAEDLSPVRRRRHDSDEDQSPPRYNQDLSAKQRDKAANLSPLRSRNEDLSPPRSITSSICKNSDLSPPRKRKSEDLSPPRRERNEDLSPPRKRSNSPQRDLKRQRVDHDVPDTKPETVYRDAQTGKKITFDEYLKQRDTQNRKKVEKKKDDVIIHKQEDMEWGSGLAQKAQQEKFNEMLKKEADAPFARYADDADLDSLYKDHVREGDPMAHLLQKKKKKRKKKDSDSEEEFVRPMYMGNWPPNRYGIPPGHRWDGKDRSNGFEAKYLQNLGKGKAMREEAYKWSSEDM